MSCSCARDLLPRLRAALHRMAGAPDYEAYRAHLRARHPEEVPLSRAAFWRERERARFGAGARRCC